MGRRLGGWLGPTPAGAGSTCSRLTPSPELGAYPRWRGEHFGFLLGLGLVIGLPPLARGARLQGCADCVAGGPTPAGAGSTRRSPMSGYGAGPTPAGAGSTRRATRTASVGRAYPRWRGEHDFAAAVTQARKGLPPLARGAQNGPGNPPSGRGPTPAGAGSTRARCRSASRRQAYPRWRGEHSCGSAAASGLIGLPPLARGAPSLACRHPGRSGPTPAGAGSTETVRPEMGNC